MGGSDRTAVLWSGGKDCALALHLLDARRASGATLVTFVPPSGGFRAHPLAAMRLQAESLGLEHRRIPLLPPFDVAYREALRELHREGFRTVVTGDIGRVGRRPNWIRTIGAPLGLRVLRPLWGMERGALLGSLHRQGIEAIISCVDRRWLGEEFLGRTLDRATCRELIHRAKRERFDPCGEQGEYHTIALYGPRFRFGLTWEGARARRRGDLSYLSFSRFRHPAPTGAPGPFGSAGDRRVGLRPVVRPPTAPGPIGRSNRPRDRPREAPRAS